MKKIILFFSLVFLMLQPFLAQDITGQWQGTLKVQSIKLRLFFNISNTGTGLSATMDSPDQGAFGIPTTTITFQDSTLKIGIANVNIDYEGILGKDQIIVGTFKQNGMTFPLNLSKDIIEKETKTRPQEPQKPYPYITEEVTLNNPEAGINLAGTLSLPNKEDIFPAVILISGSGPQDRDEALFGHKPFLVIADYLTKNGIAVLRFDDRGTAQSEGDFSSATTTDFATDVESALAYLLTRKDIDKQHIGLIGHSEGGIIAPIVASQNKKVGFIILLAGTGVPGDKILLAQQELIGRASGIDNETLEKTYKNNKTVFDIIKQSKDTTVLKSKLTALLKQNQVPEKDITTAVQQLTSPWMIQFITYDPKTALEKVTCPVLALNGEKDMQVPAKENLSAIKKALLKGGNKTITVKDLPELNHLFQECKTGAPMEYATIEQTFSPIALKEILQFIKTQTD